MQPSKDAKILSTGMEAGIGFLDLAVELPDHLRLLQEKLGSLPDRGLLSMKHEPIQTIRKGAKIVCDTIASIDQAALDMEIDQLSRIPVGIRHAVQEHGAALGKALDTMLQVLENHRQPNISIPDYLRRVDCDPDAPPKGPENHDRIEELSALLVRFRKSMNNREADQLALVRELQIRL